MSTQHTPGPWFNTSEDDYPTGQVSTSPLGSGDICVVYNDNAKADARLIAAAPMLLEALQKAQEELRCGNVNSAAERIAHALERTGSPR